MKEWCGEVRLKARYDIYSHSEELTLMCYSIDIALDICSEVDIRT